MKQPDEASRFAMTVRAELVPIRQYVRRRVAPDDVDDVVSEVFAAAWKHRKRLPDPPRFWLLRTAWFHVSRHLRHRSRQARLAGRVAALPEQLDPGPEEAAVGGADVRAALARLSPTDQEVLRLAAWEDLDAAQIAEVLACTPVAARTRLHRARRRLAHLLGDPVATLVATEAEPTSDSREGAPR